jgi:RNA recognition motif-containing protein
MPVTLYVGNLPWSLTEDELADVFISVGPVHSARIITDRDTGRSRGFGFVDLADEDAVRAIQTMDGFELKGRRLIVNEARPRARRF